MSYLTAPLAACAAHSAARWVKATGTTADRLEQLEPGQHITGTLVFDLPREVRPERLVLHDSLLSGGVSVRVSKS